MTQESVRNSPKRFGTQKLWRGQTILAKARSNAGYGALKSGLAFACSHGADCRAIQPGGSCFNPNTIQNHASYAFDSYYQTHAKNPAACNFGGTATIAVTNPTLMEELIQQSRGFQ
ncbi:hypothetical protein JHK82_021062 [Glycine max]|nr:hypothetical protein JHK85_021517 [Glycine max]KAG5025158.1 hypothetical protein JHK86_021072 [Glycine max]KAG5136331.1 hypothetical protein JHK82_021062 [Glycine max]